jgi:hypothetical protein
MGGKFRREGRGRKPGAPSFPAGFPCIFLPGFPASPAGRHPDFQQECEIHEGF